MLGVPAPNLRTIGEPIEVKRAPETGYMAQFSGPYAVAVGLLGGSGLGAGLDDYTDELARDPRRRALMAAGRRRRRRALHRDLPPSVPGRADRPAARRRGAGRGGADHPRRPAAAAVVRGARHQVPRQRRPRAAPATRPTRWPGLRRARRPAPTWRGLLPVDQSTHCGPRAALRTRPAEPAPPTPERIARCPPMRRPCPTTICVDQEALVVRPGAEAPERLDVGVTRRPVRGVRAVDRPRRGRARSSTPAASTSFPGVVDVHQHWGIYNELGEDADSESRAAAQGGVTSGITYIRTGAYYMNRTGPYREVFPDVLAATEGQGLHRLRLPRRADPQGAHRRDPRPDRGVRGPVVQDLHVLRQPRAARALDRPGLVPHDPRGRVLRHRALRVRHARHPGGPRRTSGSPPTATTSRCRCTARPPRSCAPTPSSWRQDGTLTGPRGLQRLAPAALRGPGDHDRLLPRARDRAAEHQPAAPELAQGDRGGHDDAVDVPAHRLPPRGHRRSPAGRLPHREPRRQGQPAAALAARTSRRSGSTCWPATSRGSPPTTPAARTRRSSASPRDDVFVAKSGFGGTEYLLPGHGQRGPQARPVLQQDRRADARATPPHRFGLARKGDLAVGLRRGLLPRRRRRRVRRARGGLPVHAGVHAVRGLRR